MNTLFLPHYWGAKISVSIKKLRVVIRRGVFFIVEIILPRTPPYITGNDVAHIALFGVALILNGATGMRSGL